MYLNLCKFEFNKFFLLRSCKRFLFLFKWFVLSIFWIEVEGGFIWFILIEFIVFDNFWFLNYWYIFGVFGILMEKMDKI